MVSFFNDVGKRHINIGGGKILVVAHAFAIKTILHIFAYNELKNIDKISNSSVTIIAYDGREFRATHKINLTLILHL